MAEDRGPETPSGEDRRRAEWQLAEFLTEETGDRLYTIVSYDADSHESLYLSSRTGPLFGGEGADRLVETFREEADHNGAREGAFDVGAYRCSLHLFEEWVLLHFSREDRGLVLGYDIESASNLSAFVADCRPYVERILEE